MDACSVYRLPQQLGVRSSCKQRIRGGPERGQPELEVLVRAGRLLLRVVGEAEVGHLAAALAAPHRDLPVAPRRGEERAAVVVVFVPARLAIGVIVVATEHSGRPGRRPGDVVDVLLVVADLVQDPPVP